MTSRRYLVRASALLAKSTAAGEFDEPTECSLRLGDFFAVALFNQTTFENFFDGFGFQIDKVSSFCELSAESVADAFDAFGFKLNLPTSTVCALSEFLQVADFPGTSSSSKDFSTTSLLALARNRSGENTITQAEKWKTECTSAVRAMREVPSDTMEINFSFFFPP